MEIFVGVSIVFLTVLSILNIFLAFSNSVVLVKIYERDNAEKVVVSKAPQVPKNSGLMDITTPQVTYDDPRV